MLNEITFYSRRLGKKDKFMGELITFPMLLGKN